MSCIAKQQQKHHKNPKSPSLKAVFQTSFPHHSAPPHDYLKLRFRGRIIHVRKKEQVSGAMEFLKASIESSSDVHGSTRPHKGRFHGTKQPNDRAPLRDVLGFDMEWKPEDADKKESNAVALIQICSATICVLFHMIHLNCMPFALKSLIEDESFKKVCHGFEASDRHRLERQFGIQPKNFVDTAELARNMGSWPCGLKALVNDYFFPLYLDKTLATSDWSADWLTPEQIVYAATDAWITLLLFQKLTSDELPQMCSITPVSFNDTVYFPATWQPWSPASSGSTRVRDPSPSQHSASPPSTPEPAGSMNVPSVSSNSTKPHPSKQAPAVETSAADGNARTRRKKVRANPPATSSPNGPQNTLPPLLCLSPAAVIHSPQKRSVLPDESRSSDSSIPIEQEPPTSCSSSYVTTFSETNTTRESSSLVCEISQPVTVESLEPIAGQAQDTSSTSLSSSCRIFACAEGATCPTLNASEVQSHTPKRVSASSKRGRHPPKLISPGPPPVPILDLTPIASPEAGAHVAVIPDEIDSFPSKTRVAFSISAVAMCGALFCASLFLWT